MFAQAQLLRSVWLAVSAMASAVLGAAPAGAQTDPLPSWNEGPAKAAIIDFVTGVTTTGSPSFTPGPERIAVFDNDGTLAVEQPMPAQVVFELACLRIAAPDHPEWNTIQPFKAALEKDTKLLAEGGETGFAKIMIATHEGWSTDDYETTVSSWIASTPHPRFKKPYSRLVYQPMLEVLAYMQANGFRTYILSGNSRDFMRPWVESVFGVPAERVIGSSIKTRFAIENGQTTLTRVPEIDFLDDRAGRPAGAYEHIGHRPIAAFGNSDGDLEILEWTTMSRRPHLGMIVHHTDAEREYAYDRSAGFGRLDKALDAAAGSGWTVIDMKKDWSVIFPFEKQ